MVSLQRPFPPLKALLTVFQRRRRRAAPETAVRREIRLRRIARGSPSPYCPSRPHLSASGPCWADRTSQPSMQSVPWSQMATDIMQTEPESTQCAENRMGLMKKAHAVLIFSGERALESLANEMLVPATSSREALYPTSPQPSA